MEPLGTDGIGRVRISKSGLAGEEQLADVAVDESAIYGRVRGVVKSWGEKGLQGCVIQLVSMF